MANADAKQGATPLSIAGGVLSGVLVSLIAVVLMISVAGMIFSGPLAGFLPNGIGLCLFGGIVLGILGAYGSSFRGTILHPQDVTGAILALSAASIAGRLGLTDPERLYATIAVLMAVASIVMGILFLAAGSLKLGAAARFIPYPVMGGFMAAAGFLLLIGAIRVVTGKSAFADLAQPEAVWRWLPVIILGVVMVCVARRSARPLALPAMVLAAFIGFYLWLMLSGISLEEASQRGLLLGPFPRDAGFLGAFHPALLAQADYGEILSEVPAIATMVALAFVGSMINASAIELGTGHPVDFNHDLRGIGVANLLGGLGGSPPGYHVLGLTLLMHRLTGTGSRWVGIGVGIGSAVTLVSGASLLSVLPVSVFAAVLAFLGIDVLYRWLWVERQRLPLPDFLLILTILAVSVTVGFLQAIAVGVLAASALFVLAYSRLDVIRGRTTGNLRLSTTERDEVSVRLLTDRGRETLIFELQGYVFFGTAHALLRRLNRDVEAPEANIRNVVLDFRRVQGLDASAVFNLGRLAQVCERHGVRLIFTDVRPALRRRMERAFMAEQVTVMPTLDAALAWTEQEVLAEGGAVEAEGGSEFSSLLERAAAGGTPLFRSEEVSAGTQILHQGEASDSLIFLDRGRLSASVEGPEGADPMRVATFLPGAVVGEIGLYAGTVRTANVSADIDSTIRKVTQEDLDRLSERDPALARDFHAMIAGLLARRLTRTTALLREVSK